MSWDDLELAEPDADPRADRDDLAQCYREIFKAPAGKRVLQDLAQQSAFQAPLMPDVPDAMLRHTEGKGALFAHILRMMKRGEDA